MAVAIALTVGVVIGLILVINNPEDDFDKVIGKALSFEGED